MTVATIIPGLRVTSAEALRAAVAEANLWGITSAQNTAASCERDLISSKKPGVLVR